MLALEKYVHECGLEAKLLEVVKMRASQTDCCAYCVDIHPKGARVLGETEQRLLALNAWRETPFSSGNARMDRGSDPGVANARFRQRV